MAIKFVICGDLHWRGSNPRARRDNYMQSLTEKLNEVINLSNRYHAPIIIPGDLLNSPNTAWGIVAELINVLRQADAPIVTIHGNHDIYGSNPESVIRAPYGLMDFIDVVRNVEREPFVWQDPIHDTWVRVSGYGYRASTDTPDGMWQFRAPELEEHAEDPPQGYAPVAKIHLVHANLMLEPPGIDSMPHTLISNVKTNANVIISGHYHPGFGIHHREDGVLFINPGALSRTSAGASDISRVVQVALLNIEADGKCEAELVPLRSAKPGDEVLSREHLDDAAERMARIQDFLELLAEEGQSRFMEMSEIIEDISERDKLPKEIKTEALKRLSLAREMLGVR